MTYLLSIGIISFALALWISVQHMARVFAARHPEFGPAREEGEGCGGLLCLCKDKATCPKRLFDSSPSHPAEPNHKDPQ